MTSPGPGWYRNPEDPDDIRRWWDGAAWTTRTEPIPVAAPAPAPARSEPNADDRSPARTDRAREVALPDVAGSRLQAEVEDEDEDEDDIFHLGSAEELAPARTRGMRALRNVLAFVIIAGIAGTVFWYLDREGRRLPAEREVPETVVVDTTTAPASTAPTTVLETTTTTEPPKGPFESAHGWRLDPPEEWVALAREPDSAQVFWMTPSGAVVEVTSVPNEEGMVVTPISVREGMAELLRQYFQVEGSADMADAELGGSWAVRADTSDDTLRVVVIAGSPARRTTAISISGLPESVAESLPSFEAALERFSYT